MFETHGFSKIDTAKKCFAENFKTFQSDPEKYNLYNGLANQAAAIEQMQAEIAALKA